MFVLQKSMRRPHNWQHFETTTLLPARTISWAITSPPLRRSVPTLSLTNKICTLNGYVKGPSAISSWVVTGMSDSDFADHLLRWRKLIHTCGQYDHSCPYIYLLTIPCVSRVWSKLDKKGFFICSYWNVVPLILLNKEPNIKFRFYQLLHK